MKPGDRERDEGAAAPFAKGSSIQQRSSAGDAAPDAAPDAARDAARDAKCDAAPRSVGEVHVLPRGGEEPVGEGGMTSAAARRCSSSWRRKWHS